jgi:hypothetical protein
MEEEDGLLENGYVGIGNQNISIGNIGIDCAGIGPISAKIHGYWLKYWHISAKIPGIGLIENTGIGGRYVGGEKNWYRQTYQSGEYIGICISWTNIGPTLL